MSLKEVIRAGESGGRKAAIREELLPSQYPLTKPTRDISASNRSHSITRQDLSRPFPTSDRRLILLDKEAQEFEYQKQANIVYTRQFRTLAKLLGNETMDFEELRQKVQTMILTDIPLNHDPALSQRIQMLQRQLTRKNQSAEIIGRSAQSLPGNSNSQYLRAYQNQLGKKSKLINQLSDSIKREYFEQTYRSLQTQVIQKEQALRQIEGQTQEMRLKTTAHIGTLQEQLVKRNQTIQKLTFELDTLKRKAQANAEEVDRARKRERQLSSSLQTQTRATYQGISYSMNTLLMQLQSRDQEIGQARDQQRILEEEINNYRSELITLEDSLKKSQAVIQELHSNLEYNESVLGKFQNESNSLREQFSQLQIRKMAIQQQKDALSRDVNLLKLSEQRFIQQKGKLIQSLDQQRSALKQYETIQEELKSDRDKYALNASELQMKLNQEYKQVEKLKQYIKSLEQQIKLIHSDSETLNIQKNQYEQQIKRYQTQISEELRLVDELRLQLQNNKMQLTKLTSQNGKLQQEKKQYQVNLINEQEEIRIFKLQVQEHIQNYQLQLAQLNAKLLQNQEKRQQYCGLEQQLSLKQKQYINLKLILEQAATREGQLQAVIQKKQLILKDLQDQKAQKQFQTSKLKLLISQLNEQIQQQKLRSEEEIKERDRLERELNSIRQILYSLQQNQKDVVAENSIVKNNREQLQQKMKQMHERFKQQKQKWIEERQLYEYNIESIRSTFTHEKHNIEQSHQLFVQSLVKEKQLLQNLLAKKDGEIASLKEEQQELNHLINELRSEKEEFIIKLKSMGNHQLIIDGNNKNQLGNFSFNHYETLQQKRSSESPKKQHYQTQIQELQRKLQEYRIKEDRVINLSYSNQDQNQMIASLKSQHNLMHHEFDQLKQVNLAQKKQIQEQMNQIDKLKGEVNAKINALSITQALSKRMQTELEEKQAKIRYMLEESASAEINILNLRTQLENQRSNKSQQKIDGQNYKLQQQYQSNIQHLQAQLKNSIKQNELLRKQIVSIEEQLTLTKLQLDQNQQILTSINNKLANAQSQYEQNKRQISNYQLTIEQYQKTIEKYKIQFKQIQDNHISKNSRNILKQDQFGQDNHILSRLSKKSNFSNNRGDDDDARSKEASSDGELSRKILNDPSKISGQQSKFAHLVFDNSKIHVVRDYNPPQSIDKRNAIKEQKQQQSVLSKQPQSKNRQSSANIHNIHTLQKQSSKKEISSSQKIVSSSGSVKTDNIVHYEKKQETKRKSIIQQNQKHSLTNSLTSIKQAQQFQQMSANPKQQFQKKQNSAISKETNNQPQLHKEYLPQQSSKKAISNPTESKRIIQNIQDDKNRISFQKYNNIAPMPPIYIARPTLINQLVMDRSADSSQSQSNSKKKIRISYGQPTDRSLQIKKRQIIRQEQKEEGSKPISRTNQQIILNQHSINDISPVPIRQSDVKTPSQSFFQSQSQLKKQDKFIQPSLKNSMHDIQNNQSIINGINQVGSRLSQFVNPRQSRQTNMDSMHGQIIKHEPMIRRQSSPVFVAPRISYAYSPRHSNIAFNSARGSYIYQTQPQQINQAMAQTAPISPRQMVKHMQIIKDENNIQPGRVTMRSVVGGKKNSQCNDTATFGKNSMLKSGQQQSDNLSESQDSGIQVLQYDWDIPCCRNQQ